MKRTTSRLSVSLFFLVIQWCHPVLAVVAPEIWAGSANGTVVYSQPQLPGCVPNVATTSKTFSVSDVQLQVSGSLLTPGSFTATLTATTISGPTPGVQVTCYDSQGNITGSFVVLANAGGSETGSFTINGTSDGQAVTANFINVLNGRFGTITGTIQNTAPPKLQLTIMTNDPGTNVVSDNGTATLTLRQGIVAVINGNPNTATILTTPSVFTSIESPYGIGASVLPITIECQDQSGNTVPNCMVDFDFDVMEGSGGHVHNTDRPTGDFSSSECGEPFVQHISCDTGAGVALLFYVAPEASGITETANGTVSANGLSNSFSFTINVQYDGLMPANGPGLVVDIASHNHGNNNGWASPATNEALNYMASLFSDTLRAQGASAIPVIEIDAISLPFGGLFDYAADQVGHNWLPPHISHRFGNNADVCIKVGSDCSHGLTKKQRKALASVLKYADFRLLVEASHWHLIGPY